MPAFEDGAPLVLLLNKSIGSSISTVLVFKIVCVPSTFKFPCTVKLLIFAVPDVIVNALKVVVPDTVKLFGTSKLDVSPSMEKDTHVSEMVFDDENDENNYASYSFISSWSNNYNSWKLSKNINTLFIKYEDLENDKYKTFSKIINFTNNIIKKERNIDENKFKLAIETTNFEVLQKKEEYEGFDEAVYSSKEGKMKPFFNLGRKNNYKNLLKPETSKVIEGLFEKEMKELGYI